MKAKFNFLIVGGSSFIGRNVLIAAPSDWKIIATYNKSYEFVKFVKRFKNVRVEKLDLTSSSSVNSFNRKYKHTMFDSVLYLSANSDPHQSVIDPKYDYKVNALGVLKLLPNLNCKRFVYASSGAVYLKTSLPYVLSKGAGEKNTKEICDKKNISYVICRFFEAFGPLSPARKIPRKLCEQFDRGDNKVVLYGNGKNLIDPMYIEDFAKALLKIVKSKKTATIDVCLGKPITLRELTLRIGKAFGVIPKISYKGRAVEHVYFKGNPLPLKKLFGFSAKISLEEGIKKWREFKRYSKDDKF